MSTALISRADLPDSVLVIAAHPDDEVLGCGGTIARFASENVPVRIALLADGVRSRQKDDVDGAISIELTRRRDAARLSSKILGAQSVEFNDFPDNRMDSVDRLDLARAVEVLVGQYSPEMIITHHGGDVNVDHRRVHEAVVTACRPQPGHPVHTILFFETASSTEWQVPSQGAGFMPTWFVDISPHLESKRAALEAYAEEMRTWPHSRSYAALEYLARWRGATIGVEAAEAFVLGRHIARCVAPRAAPRDGVTRGA